MSARPPQIVAFGGGGFSMEWGNPLLDDHVLSLTGVAAPAGVLPAHGQRGRRPLRRALLPRASRPRGASRRTSRCFAARPASGDPYAHLLGPGPHLRRRGQPVSLLGTWQAHGIDLALYDAWRAGVVLCGGSAGSLCWFTDVISGFHEGPPRRLEGLGFLPWSNAVHYSDEPGRRSAFLSAVAGGHGGGLWGGRRRGAALRGHGAGGAWSPRAPTPARASCAPTAPAARWRKI